MGIFLQHRQRVSGSRTAATAGLVCVLPLLAVARSDSVRFSRTTVLQEAGLSVRLMPDATAHPLPPPTIHTYQRRQGAETSLVDLYSPLEIWRATQHVGRWTDPAGNALTIARMTSLVPSRLRDKHTSRERTIDALERSSSRPRRWTTALVHQWLQDYTSAARADIEELARPPRRFADAMSITLAGARTVGFAFRLNTRHAGLGMAPDTWFVVLLQHAPAVDATAARAALLDRFLPTFSPTPTSRITRDTSPSRFMQHRDFRSGANGVAGLEDSRKLAEDSIRNLKGWWVVHTDHYVFLSNLNTRHRTLVRELQEDLEALRSSFEKLIPPLDPIDAAAVVRIFATPEEYHAYVPPPQRWTSGLWMAAKGELVIRPPPDERDRQGHRETILRIAYHEAFHQYLHYALQRRRADAWFNEGHAALFESADVRRRRTPSIEEDEAKVAILKHLAEEEVLSVDPLLRMSYEEFYAGDNRMRSINYAMAWGLAYYLRKAAPVEPGRRYEGIADAYTASLKRQGNGRIATLKAFHRVDMEQFEKDFSAFWLSGRRRSSARRHRLFR
jgi:hypothetical protein